MEVVYYAKRLLNLEEKLRKHFSGAAAAQQTLH